MASGEAFHCVENEEEEQQTLVIGADVSTTNLVETQSASLAENGVLIPMEKVDKTVIAEDLPPQLKTEATVAGFSAAGSMASAPVAVTPESVSEVVANVVAQVASGRNFREGEATEGSSASLTTRNTENDTSLVSNEANNTDLAEGQTLNRSQVENGLLIPADKIVKSEGEVNLDELPPELDTEDPQLDDLGASKTQFSCDDCGKGFCHIGWLERHRITGKCSSSSSKPSSPSANLVPNTGDNPLDPTAVAIQCEEHDVAGSPEVAPTGETLPKLRLRAEPTTTRKDRESLQGRLEELLCCPNSNCNFATYWLQSLTKHVNHSCKFGPSSSLSAPSSGLPKELLASSKLLAPVICNICSKKCNDVQEHIQHMTAVHQMKASYRCSTCGQTFPSKVAVEAHLQTHYRSSENASSDPSVQFSLDTASNSSRPKSQEAFSGSTDSEEKQLKLASASSSKGMSEETNRSFANVLPEDSNAPEELRTNGSEDEQLTCRCGKSLPDKKSLEDHAVHCRRQGSQLQSTSGAQSGEEMQMNELPAETDVAKSKTTENQVSLNSTPKTGDGESQYLEHFKREHIVLVHDSNNVKCKNCSKNFSSPGTGIVGLCNHLCRRLVCRDWYCRNLSAEIVKAEAKRTSLGLPPPEMPAKRARLSADRYRGDAESSSNGSPGSRGLRRAASLMAKTAMKLNTNSQGVEALAEPPTESEGSFKKYLPPPIHCPKCRKVFGGRCPHIAYRNHLRGARTCTPYDKTARPLAAKQQQVRSEVVAHVSGNLKLKNVSPHPQAPVSVPMNVNLEAIQQGVKYYCKLCPTREIKNRVSLGCHLTIYHGLPQVNVNTPNGDAFRCQTCCQIFNSKYFYNMHRFECDLSSSYVGVLNEDGSDASLTQQSSQHSSGSMSATPSEISGNMSTPSKLLTQNTKPSPAELKALATPSNFFSNTYKCSLCNKTGFWGPNAVKIHQKYQCVKRNLLPAKPHHYLAVTKQKNFQFPPKGTESRPKGQVSGSLRSDVGQHGVNGTEETGGEGKVYLSELARMNDLAKQDSRLTMCDACGRGPYNSYYYFLEHKRTFCRALKGKKQQCAQKGPLQGLKALSPKSEDHAVPAYPTGRAGKSITQRKPNVARKSFPPPSVGQPLRVPFAQPMVRQTAKKTMSNVPSMEIGSGPMTTPRADGSEGAHVVAPEILFKAVKCSVCPQELEDIEKFVKHRIKHITTDMKEGNGPSDHMTCEICRTKISHYQRMQQHLILHLQNFSALRQQDLVDVKRRQSQNKMDDDSDDDEPVLSCPYCKASYVSRVDLANHIRNSCPFRYQCSQCQRTYLTKESLNEHKEQCVRNSQLRGVSSKSLLRCKNCGLEFKVKQQLLWHEYACSKIYSADLSGRVEEIIQRTLACGVCGMVSKDYDNKLKHEKRCLQRYLTGAGYRPPLINDTDSDIDLYELSNPEDLSSLASSDGPIDAEELITLKKDYGITRDLQVSLLRLNEDIMTQYKAQLYLSSESELAKTEALKNSFVKLLRRLITDEEILEEMVEGEPAEAILAKMLQHLGEEPVGPNGLSDLANFRQNLQTFIKLSIKEETLERAYYKAESVDEVVYNLLNFPYELQ